MRRQVNACLAIETPVTSFARSCNPANKPHITYYCSCSLVHGMVTHGGARPGASRLDLITFSRAVAACRCTHHDADRSTEHASSHYCMHTCTWVLSGPAASWRAAHRAGVTRSAAGSQPVLTGQLEVIMVICPDMLAHAASIPSTPALGTGSAD